MWVKCYQLKFYRLKKMKECKQLTGERLKYIKFIDRGREFKKLKCKGLLLLL